MAGRPIAGKGSVKGMTKKGGGKGASMPPGSAPPLEKRLAGAKHALGSPDAATPTAKKPRNRRKSTGTSGPNQSPQRVFGPTTFVPLKSSFFSSSPDSNPTSEPEAPEAKVQDGTEEMEDGPTGPEASFSSTAQTITLGEADDDDQGKDEVEVGVEVEVEDESGSEDEDEIDVELRLRRAAAEQKASELAVAFERQAEAEAALLAENQRKAKEVEAAKLAEKSAAKAEKRRLALADLEEIELRIKVQAEVMAEKLANSKKNLKEASPVATLKPAVVVKLAAPTAAPAKAAAPKIQAKVLLPAAPKATKAPRVETVLPPKPTEVDDEESPVEDPAEANEDVDMESQPGSDDEDEDEAAKAKQLRKQARKEARSTETPEERDDRIARKAAKKASKETAQADSDDEVINELIKGSPNETLASFHAYNAAEKGGARTFEKDFKWDFPGDFKEPQGKDFISPYTMKPVPAHHNGVPRAQFPTLDQIIRGMGSMKTEFFCSDYGVLKVDFHIPANLKMLLAPKEKRSPLPPKTEAAKEAALKRKLAPRGKKFVAPSGTKKPKK
ncbi:hypothetical protein P7C70_g6906, partial [Phenoliferia sp. Uapishka_3]